MSKNVTVAVPDEMRAKMVKYKEMLRPSKVFQEAMGRQLEEIELFRLQTSVDTREIIERLSREKIAVYDEWYSKGRADGLQWFKSASYDKIRHIVEIIPSNDGNLMQDEMIGDDMRLVSSKYGPKLVETAWEKGFKDAVIEFFERIKDKL